MSFDIFRVDWILVSSVTIILLLIFLICVKIYKLLTRWRYTFVNEDIYLSSYSPIEKEYESNIKTCHWNYAINNKLMNKSDPTIIILRTKKRINLLRVITEGLSSYGLTVINIFFSINKKSSLEPNINNINYEIKSIISSIMEIISGSLNNNKYILLSYYDKNIDPIYITYEKNYHGHIIINPKSNIEEKQENLTRKIGINSVRNIYYIFSEYSTLKFKNKIAKKSYGTQTSTNSIIVSNASRNFKYFETILFGIILTLINKIKTHV
jgi:hypothetical protein